MVTSLYNQDLSIYDSAPQHFLVIWRVYVLMKTGKKKITRRIIRKRHWRTIT